MAKKKKKALNPRNKGPGTPYVWQLYEVGEKTETGIIATIIEQTPDYSIFIYENGCLGWDIKDLADRHLPALAECQRLDSEVKTSVSRKYENQISSQMGAALVSALDTLEGGDCLAPFVAVKAFIEEKKKEIQEIYSYGSDFFVYLKSDDSVEWWHENLPDHLKPAVSEFERLLVTSRIALPDNYHPHMSVQLAWALTAAFRSGEDYDFKPAFDKVEQFIESRTFAKARFEYVMASIFTAAIGITLTFVFTLLPTPYGINQFVDSTVLQFILGGCSGMIGALLSVLQRGRKLKLDPMSPRQIIIMQSATRILIGIISGTIIVIAAKSELALGGVAINTYALMLFAVISGFSERYVPDLMDNISSSTKTAPEDKSEED